jgi:hypothetical protein
MVPCLSSTHLDLMPIPLARGLGNCDFNSSNSLCKLMRVLLMADFRLKSVPVSIPELLAGVAEDLPAPVMCLPVLLEQSNCGLEVLQH